MTAGAGPGFVRLIHGDERRPDILIWLRTRGPAFCRRGAAFVATSGVADFLWASGAVGVPAVC